MTTFKLCRGYQTLSSFTRKYSGSKVIKNNYALLTEKSVLVKDSDFSFSYGKVGHLSDSSVLFKAGGTVIHATVNSNRNDNPSDAFLPLTVDYRYRQYGIHTYHNFTKLLSTINIHYCFNLLSDWLDS